MSDVRICPPEVDLSEKRYDSMKNCYLVKELGDNWYIELNYDRWWPYKRAEEFFALCDQIRRAVISIPSNIAEGQGRSSLKEFLYFLSIARGSKAELETQLLLCVKVDYLKESEVQKAMCLVDEVGKMIYSLQKKLATDYW